MNSLKFDIIEFVKLFQKELTFQNVNFNFLIKKNNLHVDVSIVTNLNDLYKKQMYKLTKENMKKIRKKSTLGWSKNEKEQFNNSNLICLYIKYKETDELIKKEEIIGFLLFSYELDEENQEIFYILEMQISKLYQSKGFGSLMMSIIKNFGKIVKIKKIVLTVLKNNNIGINFYNKQNYKNDNTCPSVYGYNDLQIQNEQQTQNDMTNKKNDDNLCKVFMGNIPRPATDDQITEYFSSKGFIFKEMTLMKDPANSALNRGFGFFTLETEEDTDRLLFTDLEPFQGKNLDIKRAAPKDCDDPLIQIKTERVFIGGLPQTFTVEDLTQLFDSKYGKIGKVIEVIPKKDKVTGKSRGFCFVVFENYHVVDKILIDNRFPYLHNKRLEIRKASSDFPTQGAPPIDSHMQRRGPGGKVFRQYDRLQRINVNPYRNGGVHMNNMRQLPRRLPPYINNPHMQSAQYNKQTYGFTNRPPPVAYTEGAPTLPPNPSLHSVSYNPHHQSSHQLPPQPQIQSDIPYNVTAATNYVAYGTGTSQLGATYPGPGQYNPNPYSNLNYSATQGGYQTYNTSSLPSTNPNVSNSNQPHSGY